MLGAATATARIEKEEHWTFNDVISCFEYAYVKLETVPISIHINTHINTPLIQKRYIVVFDLYFCLHASFFFISRLIVLAILMCARALVHSLASFQPKQFSEQQWLIQVSLNVRVSMVWTLSACALLHMRYRKWAPNGKTTIELCFYCIIAS